jgi:hypothetical protein
MTRRHPISELRCRRCRSRLTLGFKDCSLTRHNVRLLIRSCPVLRCENSHFSRSLASDLGKNPQTGGISVRKSVGGFAVLTLHHTADPNNRFQVFDPKIFSRLRRQGKKQHEIRLKIPRRRFNYCKVPFSYDPRDYYYFPGLYRAAGDGYLTPVFFKKEVLLKYIFHPECAVDFASDTYGTIHTSDKDMIAFGLNRSDRVIMWLGDIDRLSKSEQYYLKSENVESDHDIASQFYEAQIDVEFTPPSREKALLRARHDTGNRIIEKLGVKLTQLDLEEMEVVKRIARPIAWDDNNAGRSFDNLNRVLAETINAKALKQDLYGIDRDVDLTKLNTLKLLQRWLEKRCGFADARRLLCPLFVLYDLRIVFVHLVSFRRRRKTVTSACRRLGLQNAPGDLETIYDALIDKLKQMYQEIDTRIASL